MAALSKGMSAVKHVRRERLSHDARRQQIIETTLVCLARDGADGTSLRSVCREIGVAPSLVKHFFIGWHDLLTASYEMLTERFMAQLSPVLSNDAPNARARMDTVILRYLSTDWIGESSIGANIAFWQLARSVVDLKPHFSRFLRDRAQLLKKVLDALAAEAGVEIDLDELTACFILLLDGIWLELSTNPGNIQEQRAVELCWFWLNSVLRPAEASTNSRTRTRARGVTPGAGMLAPHVNKNTTRQGGPRQDAPKPAAITRRRGPRADA